MKAAYTLLISVLFVASGCSSLNRSSLDRSNQKILSEKAEHLPRQIVVLSFPVGASSVPVEKQGLTSMLSEIIKEGPRGQDSLEFKKQLFLLNAEMSLYPGPETLTLVVRAPEDNLAEALQLSLNVIRQPKLDDKTFKKIKSRTLINRQIMNENMRQVVFYYGPRDMFSYHPRTLDGTGSPASIGNVKQGDIHKFSRRLQNTSPFLVVTAGPMDNDDVRSMLEKQAGVTGKFTPPAVTPIDVSQFRRKQLKVTIINKPKAKDNQVLFLKPIEISEDSQRFVTAQVAHHLLGGGGLSSRLFKTLREEKGLTYAAVSDINGVMKRWMIYSFASTDKMKSLLENIPPLLKSFQQEDIAAEEIEEAQQSLISDHKSQHELPQDRLLAEMRYRTYGLNADFMHQFPEHVKKVTASDIKAFAKEHINMEGGYLYLMGDAQQIRPLIEKLEWVDKEHIEVIRVPNMR